MWVYRMKKAPPKTTNAFRTEEELSDLGKNFWPISLAKYANAPKSYLRDEQARQEKSRWLATKCWRSEQEVVDLLVDGCAVLLTTRGCCPPSMLRPPSEVSSSLPLHPLRLRLQSQIPSRSASAGSCSRSADDHPPASQSPHQLVRHMLPARSPTCLHGATWSPRCPASSANPCFTHSPLPALCCIWRRGEAFNQVNRAQSTWLGNFVAGLLLSRIRLVKSRKSMVKSRHRTRPTAPKLGLSFGCGKGGDVVGISIHVCGLALRLCDPDDAGVC